jgi:hypothetical protein
LSNGIDLTEELKKHNSTIPLLKLKDGIIATNNISLDDLTIILIDK